MDETDSNAARLHPAKREEGPIAVENLLNGNRISILAKLNSAMAARNPSEVVASAIGLGHGTTPHLLARENQLEHDLGTAHISLELARVEIEALKQSEARLRRAAEYIKAV